MKTKKIIKSILGFTLLAPSAYLVVSCGGNTSQEITILYTNDTHAALENSSTKLGFANLAGYRDSLNANGIKTLLVDAGDFVQGSTYGTIGQGKHLVDMFNACKYDLVTPGNHEFDFGMDRFNEIVNDLHCPMICGNLYHVEPITQARKDRVLDDTKIFNINNKKIGFVGLTSPQTLTNSNPKSFQDSQGNYIYTFLGYKDPAIFYNTVQQSLNYLKDNKCDYIFGLCHLGIQPEATEYETENLIKHTSGFDAILDGHTHAKMEKTIIQDINKKDVVVTQTGTQFESFGSLTIKTNNELDFKLIDSCDLVNDDVKKTSNRIKAEVDEQLSVSIGTIDFTLRIDDGADEPKRVVRKQECNAADFYADGLAYGCKGSLEQAPVSIANGGSIRKNIEKGKVTLGDIMNISPFGNNVAIIEVTGQTLLDALEYSVYIAEKDEFGGFLQPSSRLHYEADLTYETPCVVENETFIKVDSSKKRRVTKATIDDVDIDPNKTYQLGGASYILKDLGNGFTMFKDAKSVSCPVCADYDALANYFKYCYENNLLEQYRTVQNRIVLTK